MRIAAYGIHTPQHLSPHAHILITGFDPETGRTAENDLSFNALQYYQNKWPRGAKVEYLQSNRKAIDYLLNPKNAEITGFDILTFDDKLISQFRQGKKLPVNVNRRKAGLPLVDPAKNDPAAIGRVKAKLKRLKKKNGNIIEIKQLEQRLELLKAS